MAITKKAATKKRSPAKRLTPREARTPAQIIKLPYDNVDHRDFWMMLGEGHVTLAKQRIGQSAATVLEIPRDVFDGFVDWYNTGKVPAFDTRTRKRS